MFRFPHTVVIQLQGNSADSPERQGIEQWLIEKPTGRWEGSLIIKQNYYNNETLEVRNKEEANSFSYGFPYSDLFKHNIVPYNHLLVIAFENVNDALSFKLRWNI